MSASPAVNSPAGPPAGSPVPVLDAADMRQWIEAHVPAGEFSGKRVLLIVPDGTRTAPLPTLFHALFDRVGSVAAKFDVMIALGTHQPMSESQILALLGITPAERAGRMAAVACSITSGTTPPPSRGWGRSPAATPRKFPAA